MKKTIAATALGAMLMATAAAPAHAWRITWSGFVQGMHNTLNEGRYYGYERDRRNMLGNQRPMCFSCTTYDRSSGNARKSTSSGPTQVDRSSRR